MVEESCCVPKLGRADGRAMLESQTSVRLMVVIKTHDWVQDRKDTDVDQGCPKCAAKCHRKAWH